jgi:biopolymer transport protein ExbD
MAFSTNGLGSRGRRGGTAPLAEINVTPFVDVVLVLLIIFMLTAHVMEYGLEVDVPQTKTVKTSTKELPIVTITKTGAIYLGKQEVNFHELGDVIHTRFAGQNAVYVRADKETPYDPIAQVISELGDAKLQVSLVTQPQDTSRLSGR